MWDGHSCPSVFIEPRRARVPVLRFSKRSTLTFAARQVHFKYAAGKSRAIVNADAPLHLSDEIADDVQAESRALLPSCQFAPGAKEHAKDTLPQFGRDAVAVVRDARDDSPPIRHAHVDLHFGGVARVLDRVVHKIAEDGLGE